MNAAAIINKICTIAATNGISVCEMRKMLSPHILTSINKPIMLIRIKPAFPILFIFAARNWSN